MKPEETKTEKDENIIVIEKGEKDEFLRGACCDAAAAAFR